MTNLLKYAIWYAAFGWRIFPLQPGKKQPITSHGVKDATTDEAQIRAWWEKWPKANIGLACGGASGVYVIDIDVNADKGIDGFSSLKEFPSLPPTTFQHTPRGGLHAFYYTDNPPANKNNFRPGVDIRGDGYYVVLAPSVLDPYDGCPEGGEYKWGEDNLPWECEPVEYPDFMRPTKPAAKQEVSPVNIAPGTDTRMRYSNDICRRASCWLARCDPAVQGQGGHDKLFWAAQGMVSGLQLSDSQAYSLLASEYNPRCVPPWDLGNQRDEKDFRRKITEARKNPPRDKPLGWLLNDPDYAQAPGVEIDTAKLIANHIEKTHQEAAVDSCDYRIKKEAQDRDEAARARELEFLIQPTGLLGEICSWINATSMRPQPFLTLGCTLAFLGALYGRKIKDANDGRTNLYCMGVAQSSAGKNNAPKRIRRLCMYADCIDLLGGDNFASDSAIELRVAKRPATIFLVDEIGHLMAHLKSGSPHHTQIVSLLMRLYSTASDIYLGKEYAEEGKQRTIIEPCCCIYGMATPERFTDGISPKEIQDGWLSRCLMFHSDEYPPKNRGARPVPPPESIVTQCAEWWKRGNGETDGHTYSQFQVKTGELDGAPQFAEAPPQQIVVEATPEAERVFIKFDDTLTEFSRINNDAAVMYAKGEENARRVALICAASENASKPEITASIADYACRLIQFLLDSFLRVVVPEIAESQIGKNKRRIVAMINKCGVAGCRHRKITRKTQWTDQRSRNNLIGDLLEAEEIFREPDGRTFRYWTPEHYIALKAREATKE